MTINRRDFLKGTAAAAAATALGAESLPAGVLPNANGGRVLNAAIDKYVYVVVKQRFDDDIYLNYSRKEIVSRVADIQHDLVGEPPEMRSSCNKEAVIVNGRELLADDDVRTLTERVEAPTYMLWAPRGMVDDPDGLANPGKVMPTPRLCGEVPGPYRQHPLEAAGLAERF